MFFVYPLKPPQKISSKHNSLEGDTSCRMLWTRKCFHPNGAYKKSLWHLVRLLKPTSWSSFPSFTLRHFHQIQSNFMRHKPQTSKLQNAGNYTIPETLEQIAPENRPSTQNERILSQPSMSSGAMAVTFRECRNLISVVVLSLCSEVSVQTLCRKIRRNNWRVMSYTISLWS